MIDVSKYIRMARENDLPDLLRFAREFHRSSPYRGMKFSLEKTKSGMESIIRGGGLNAVILVATKDDKPVGMVIAVCGGSEFSEDRVATELAWYVEPEHRNGKRALLLFESYEEWAKRVGCRFVHGAYLTSSPDLSGFYNRKGYSKVEESYLKGMI